MIREDECLHAGLDPKKVSSIVHRLSRAAKDAQALGLTIFGGSGSGTLRWHGDSHDYDHRPLVVAELDAGSWDGGDGACMEDINGLMRGE